MGNFIASLCLYDTCDSDRECGSDSDNTRCYECDTSLWNRTCGGYDRSIPYSNWVNTEKYKHHFENDPCYVHPNVYPHVNKYQYQQPPPPYNPEYIPEYIKQTREASEISESS